MRKPRTEEQKIARNAAARADRIDMKSDPVRLAAFKAAAASYTVRNRKAHPERYRARQAKWRDSNPEMVASAHSRYADKSPKARAEALSRFRINHPDRTRVWDKNKHDRVRQAKLVLKPEYDPPSDGLCEICRNPESRVSKKGTQFRLSLDHDHINQAWRGWICSRCNSSLGHSQDNVMLLGAMISYLNRFEGVSPNLNPMTYRMRRGDPLYPTPTHERGSLCECCGNAETKKDRRSGKLTCLSLDHCHTRNIFRGWLCARCNWVLGHTLDSTVTLSKMIAYLDRASARWEDFCTLKKVA